MDGPPAGKSGKSEIRMPSRYLFGLKIVANAPDKEGERKKGEKRKRKFKLFLTEIKVK